MMWPWGAPVVALPMAALVLIPAEVWDQPDIDGVYEGFDQNLIYIDLAGNLSVEGMVRASLDSLEFTALPGSQPAVHLISSAIDFKLAMDVTVLAGSDGIPFRISLWRPIVGIGYYLDFGPSPENMVVARTVEGGALSDALVRGTVIGTEILGQYDPGIPYHLELQLNSETGIIRSRVSSSEGPPPGGAVLRVGDPGGGLHLVVEEQGVTVVPEEEYTVGGVFKLVSGQGPFAIGVNWWSKEGTRVARSDHWQPVYELNGWTERQITVKAPPGARVGRFYVGSANGTVLLVADPLFRETGRTTINLLPVEDFRRGSKNWRVTTSPGGKPTIMESFEIVMESTVSSAEALALFFPVYPGRPAVVTVSASSEEDISKSLIENYRVELPHQKQMGVKIEDSRANAILVALLILGSLMCSVRIGTWIRTKPFRCATRWARGDFAGWTGKPIILRQYPLILGVSGAGLVYLFLNSLLFNLSSATPEISLGKAAGYIGASYGVDELYYLARLSTDRAVAWGGVPIGSGNFPYGPVLAYINTAIGWIARLFFAAPGGFSVQPFQLTFLLKSFNVLFAFADGVLIYLILRHFALGQRMSLLGSSLFLFNPALWLLMSVWGNTHTIALFFFASICIDGTTASAILGVV